MCCGWGELRSWDCMGRAAAFLFLVAFAGSIVFPVTLSKGGWEGVRSALGGGPEEGANMPRAYAAITYAGIIIVYAITVGVWFLVVCSITRGGRRSILPR